MSRSVVFRRVAKLELEDAIAWYEEREEGLGTKFRLAITEQLERIATSPDQFAYVRGQIRRAVLRRFPYSIYFLSETDRLVVLAIFHAKRSPQRLEPRFYSA